MEKAFLITIDGLVQGIGFRPFIYRCARRLDLCGWVRNNTDSVQIFVQGDKDRLVNFKEEICNNSPPPVRIDSFVVTDVCSKDISDFNILESSNEGTGVTDVIPDIAVCDYCLQDMKSDPRRINYLFTNCTLCGPRFSILHSAPYDRCNTTMASFVMCDYCILEYSNMSDRRFHAQPISCTGCGPEYTLHGKHSISGHSLDIIKETARLIDSGAIVAVKGMGGFHLVCDAFNEESLKRLRILKLRDNKPFALMVGNYGVLDEYAFVGHCERDSLDSPIRPIVLLRQKKDISPLINCGLKTLGVMFPYMPLHYLLFENLKTTVLVFTSGNISGEPVVTDNEDAVKLFGPLTDAQLTYNRDIQNRTDDSVVAVFSDSPRVFRRSRGIAPLPVNLPWNVDNVFAAGAELKNCFAVGKATRAFLSQHIGDLKNSETYFFYEEAFNRLLSLFRITPEFAVCDLHPDYLSTRFAQNLGLPLLRVQHHHAHVASCLAEHGLDELVIGVVFDGTGYGDDGTLWGGEFLVCNLLEYRRFTHFRPVMLAGGDKAVEEPWRIAVAYLLDCEKKNSINVLPSLCDMDDSLLESVLWQLDNNVNCFPSSGAGRIFDGVSSMLGLCRKASFDGEAAMLLENLCVESKLDSVSPYPWIFADQIDMRPMFRRICLDIDRGCSREETATRFHATIINVVETVCEEIRRKEGLNKIVLSGGCWQNRYIFENSEKKLTGKGFTVLSHRNVPCNDGGIALGQLVTGAKKRSTGCV